MATEPKVEERSIEDVRAGIRRSREQVATSAIVLREKAAKLNEVRSWFNRSPVLFALGAIAGALVVGYALGQRKKSKGNGAMEGLQTLAKLLRA